MLAKRLLPALGVALFLLLLLPAFAQASSTVVLINNSGHKAAFAVRYHSSKHSGWVTQGWWSVDPHSKRPITLGTNNSVIYYYAKEFHSGSWSWPKQSLRLGERVKSYTVVNDKFLVGGNNVPRGRNGRNVKFLRVDSNNNGNFVIKIK